MDIQMLHEFCLGLRGTTTSFPFNKTTLVFKVAGKMYALASLDSIPLQVNLKCEPGYALSLREQWPEDVFPGYHMNKKHWNTVVFEGALPDTLLRELVLHSYERVVRGLPRKRRIELGV